MSRRSLSAIKRGDLGLERFIFLFHARQVVACERYAFHDAFRGQQIGHLLELGLDALGLLKIFNLDQSLAGQRLDQVVGLAHAYSQTIRQRPLGNLRLTADNLEDAEVSLFLKCHAWTCLEVGRAMPAAG